MTQNNQLGSGFVSKKILKELKLDVPEDALGFFVKDKVLHFEVMDADSEMGMLVINVETQDVFLTDEQYAKLKQLGYDSEEGFRLGV